MFATRSTCHASRTAILTGLFSRSSVESNLSDRVKPEALTEMFPDLLRDAGYRTGLFGKWHAKMPKGFGPEEHTLDFLLQSQGSAYTDVVPSSMKQPQVWKYTLECPADDWTRRSFNDSHWKSGQGGFGRKGTKGLKFGTLWSSSDIWLRRDFTLAENAPAETRLMLHHDEDAEVYLNGVLAASATGFSTEYRDLPISPEALRTLRKGTNVIAVHCQNDGGGQAIDVGLVIIQESPDGVPPKRQSPGFVEVFKRLGVDIVHLAEFHNGRTPKLKAPERLK